MCPCISAVGVFSITKAYKDKEKLVYTCVYSSISYYSTNISYTLLLIAYRRCRSPIIDRRPALLRHRHSSPNHPI